MSIFDDLGDAFHALTHNSAVQTVSALGQAAATPLMTAYDIAKFPWDTAEHGVGSGFHELTRDLAGEGNRFLRPFTDGNTWTGSVFQKTSAAMNTAAHQFFRPLSAFAIMAGHVENGQTGHGGLSGWTDLPGELGGMFDGHAWSQAYDLANKQSFAQSVLYDFGSHDGDPLAEYSQNPGTTPWGATYGHNVLMNFGADALDFAVDWRRDPTVLLGKLAGARHVVQGLGKITSADQGRLATALGTYDRNGLLVGMGADDPTGMGLFKQNRRLTNRVDQHLAFISGDNKYGRPLSAQEIYAAEGKNGELHRSSNGMTIAAMMSTAAHIEDPVQRAATYKMLVAATSGDPLAIEALRAKSAAGNQIANGLENIIQGGPVDLETHGLNEWARFDPQMFFEYQRQLNDQDFNGDLTDFANRWLDKVNNSNHYTDLMLETHRNGGLDYIPGRHDKSFGLNNPLSKGNRALSRVNEERLVDKTTAAHEAALQRIADWAHEPRSTVWQQGLAQVPLIIAKGASFPLSWYDGRYIRNMTDSLRDPHYLGQVDVHDWNGSLPQIDSMLKQSHVPLETRQAIIDQAAKAITEGDKLQSTHVALSAAFQGIADHWGKVFDQPVDPAFVQEVVRKNMTKSKAALASFNGVQYSAAKLPPEMMARPDIAKSIQDARQQADDLFYKGDQSFGAEGVPQNNWRVDQQDEESRLFALPLLESQLENKIPLLDVPTIEMALKRAEVHKRFADYSQAWRQHASELSDLQARAVTASGMGADLMNRAIKAKQVMMDALLDGATYVTRAWKSAVLFRLGFPQRVLADDHMRIANKLHWMREFAFPNTVEATGDIAYNHLPSFVPGSRAHSALQAWKQLRFERNQIASAAGLTSAHTQDTLHQIQQASSKALAKGATDADRAAYSKLVSDTGLDPEGHISEWFTHRSKAKAFQSKINGKLRAIKNHEAEGNAQAAAQARLELRKLEGSRDYHVSQMPDQDPYEVRKQLDDYDQRIAAGWRSLKEEKRRLGYGDATIKTKYGKIVTEGAYGAHGRNFKPLASSDQTFENVKLGPEGEHSAIQRAGAWRTIARTEPYYMEAYADVLNHQIRNSAIAMHVINNPRASVQDIAKWIGQPEQRILRERMEWFAKDPTDWAGRVQQHVRQYVPTEELRAALAKGEVSPDELDRMIPEGVRPDIHGRDVDYNTGRSPAAKLLSRAYNGIYKVLGEVPTDQLSRHPLFNSMYRKELKDISTNEIAYAKKMGNAKFTEADLRGWEQRARAKALNHVKSTLWDVAAHTHAGHFMRYASPFFTAHVEALSRWWRIAQDDPAVLRKFNLAFDAPRRLGLVYDATTGEPVQPGESISQNHRIIMQLPLTGNSTIDHWLKKLGGGWKFTVSENGLNVLLQNGIANPGTGPLITLPVTELAKKYADDPTITKFANMVNPYPQDGLFSSIMPGSVSKFTDWMRARKGNFDDAAYSQAYRMRLNDLLVDYLKNNNDVMPTGKNWADITRAAGQQAQHDLYLQFLSSMVGFTPARAEGKYAATARGWQEIQQVGRAQGKDYNWMVDKFREKYKDVYMPLIYSTFSDPGRLAGTPGEVSAVKQYRGLVGSLQNSRVVRAIVGPTAAQLASTDPAMGQVTKEARLWLTQQNVLRDGSALLNTKDPQTSATDGMISEGWDEYDKAMNQLTVLAEKYGLVDSNGAVNWSNKYVQGAKQAMIQALGKDNTWWLNDYNGHAGVNYDTIVQDLQQVATNKSLANNPERPDIKLLQQYLSDRSQITKMLGTLAQRGQVHSVGAKGLADVWSAFQQEIDQMRSESTYFDQYIFNGLIEFDPMYQAGLKFGAPNAQ